MLTSLIYIYDLFSFNCCKMYIHFQRNTLSLYLSDQLKTVSNIHSYRTRQRYNAYIYHRKFEIQNQSFNHKVSNSWNQIPLNLRPSCDVSVKSSMRSLKKYLVSLYPASCSLSNCYICNRWFSFLPYSNLMSFFFLFVILHPHPHQTSSISS